MHYRSTNTAADLSSDANVLVNLIGEDEYQRLLINIGRPKYPLDGNDFARLNVGNHWRGLFGSMLQLDDGRVHLPELRSREQTVVPLDVTVPPKQGLYKLEVDIVEEGVT